MVISATLKSEEKPLYLVLGAVPQETKPIEAALENRQRGELAGFEYFRGTLGENEVVVSLTGVGKTFTGMITALFLHEFQPAAAFYTGTGARINPELKTGDVIVPTSAFIHDFGSLGDDGIALAGLQPPSVPNQAPLLDNDFQITQSMHEKAMELISVYTPHTVVVDGEPRTVSIRAGKVTSGDFFGVPQTQIDALRGMKVDIMEMESAPFAVVCQLMKVPFLVVRSGSNQAQAKPSDDYLKYGPIAAESAATTTLYLVSHW